MVEVDQPHPLLFFLALRIFIFNRDAVADQSIQFAVGGNPGHRGAAIAEAGQRFFYRRFRYLGVQAQCRRFQPIRQNYIALVAATRAIVQIVRLDGIAVEQRKAKFLF
jgi:hypothetical protein